MDKDNSREVKIQNICCKFRALLLCFTIVV